MRVLRIVTTRFPLNCQEIDISSSCVGIAILTGFSLHLLVIIHTMSLQGDLTDLENYEESTAN
jgi:hypothetical protein